MEDNNSKKILLSVLGVAILVVAVVGISFALFTSNDQITGANTIQTGTITMSFSEKTNGITLNDALPMSETDALANLVDAGEYFDFDVVTTTSVAGTVIPYKIAVEKGEGTLTNSQIAINLQKLGTDGNVASTLINGKTVADVIGADATSGTIYTVSNNEGTVAGKTDSYRLRIWIDGSQDATKIAENSKYSLKVNIIEANK